MLLPHIVLPLMFLSEFRVDNQCSVGGWRDKEDWQPLTSFMESRCLSNPKTLEDVKQAWVDSFRCWEHLKPYSRVSPSTSWCTDYPEKSYFCIRDLIDKLEGYMIPEEKYFSDFMLTSYNYTTEQLCKDGEDSYKQKLREADHPRCEDDTGKMAYFGIKKCVPKLKIMQDLKDVYVVINKSDFCSSFREAADCIVDYLEEQCTDHGFSSFLDTIFKSHLHWCSNNV